MIELVVKKTQQMELPAPPESFADVYKKGEAAGFDKGYEKGNEEGYPNGYKDGYNTGFSEGEGSGYSSGYENGKAEGEAIGYNNGFSEGKQEGFIEGEGVGYSNGFAEGEQEGYVKGEESGIELGKEERDSWFWDNFQQNGARTCYNGAFLGWTDEMFYPKHNIILGQLYGTSLNSNSAFATAKIKNIKKRLEECGVKIVFQSLSTQTMFLGCETEELPLFDCTGAQWISWVSMLQGCTTRNLNMKNATFHYINHPFNNCPNLEEITLEGCRISPNGYNNLRFDSCPKLTAQSMVNVFNILDDITGTGKVCVITVGATNLAKLSEGQKAIATNKGWTLA